MRAALAPATLLLTATLFLAGCGPAPAASDEIAHADPANLAIYQPAFGSNEIFREATAAAEGHELIIADLLLPPGAVGVPHSHPWEEYLYVLGGSAVLDLGGIEPRELSAGESFIIPRQTVHTPRAGTEGIRAIIVRVHNLGDPVMLPVDVTGPAE